MEEVAVLIYAFSSPVHGSTCLSGADLTVRLKADDVCAKSAAAVMTYLLQLRLRCQIITT